MPIFEYEAVDASGKRYVERTEASSWTEVLAKLRQMGLTVVDIREVAPKGQKQKKGDVEISPRSKAGRQKSIWQMEISFGSGVSSQDLSVVSKQLAALIQSGIGIVDALELVADSIDNKILKRELVEIAQEIREGTSFSKSLEKRKKVFGDFFISMAQVGEETGQLDLVLMKVSEYYKRISEIVNKIKSASFYPAFVSMAATVITLGILYFLVPTFAQIYRSLGGELPAMTQMLIQVSNWLQQNILYFLGGVLVFVILFVLLYKKIYNFKKVIHFLQLKLPLFGPLFVKGALAKLSRTFATLFASGVSVERALELSGKVAGNVIYQEALEKVRDDVIHGEPMWKSFEKTQRFPRMFIAMVKIGEETGQLDSMLDSLADFYEDEVKTTIDGLISMIEPLMMVIIGGIVGTILIALYLPIFKMGELIH